MSYEDTNKASGDITPDDVADTLRFDKHLFLSLHHDKFALDALSAYITAVKEDGGYPDAVEIMEETCVEVYGML